MLYLATACFGTENLYGRHGCPLSYNLLIGLHLQMVVVHWLYAILFQWAVVSRAFVNHQSRSLPSVVLFVCGIKLLQKLILVIVVALV